MDCKRSLARCHDMYWYAENVHEAVVKFWCLWWCGRACVCVWACVCVTCSMIGYVLMRASSICGSLLHFTAQFSTISIVYHISKRFSCAHILYSLCTKNHHIICFHFVVASFLFPCIYIFSLSLSFYFLHIFRFQRNIFFFLAVAVVVVVAHFPFRVPWIWLFFPFSVAFHSPSSMSPFR